MVLKILTILNNLIIHIFMIDFNIFKIECLNLGHGQIIKYVKVIWTVVKINECMKK